MDIKGLSGSTILVYDAVLALDRPIFQKDVRQKTGMSERTIQSAFKTLVQMGLVRKAPRGRWEADHDNPCTELFNRIRGIEYEPFARHLENEHPTNTVIVPRSEEDRQAGEWEIV